MVDATINKVLGFYGVTAEVLRKEFRSFKTIPKSHTGIYVITQGDSVIYVGKGQIRKRQRTHWDKAYGLTPPSKKDPSGWLWLRENVDITPAEWKLTYIILYKQAELSAVEGGLICLLKPLANDETFKDEQRTLKNSL